VLPVPCGDADGAGVWLPSLTFAMGELRLRRRVKNQNYYTGGEIHVGDRVVLAGCPATILLFIDRDEFPSDDSEANRRGSESPSELLGLRDRLRWSQRTPRSMHFKASW